MIRQRRQRVRFFALLLAFLALLSMPAFAGEILTLSGSSAKIAPGSGPAAQLGNLRNVGVVVNVTAGSGTVSTFRAWIEQSVDGITFAETACDLVLKGGATPPGSGRSAPRRDIVNEAALVTSAIYSATCAVSGAPDPRTVGRNRVHPQRSFRIVAFVK